MRTRVMFVAALVVEQLACSVPRPRPPKGELVVTFEGRIENGPFRFGRDDLPALPRRTFKAVSPLTGKEQSFEGIDVSAVLADSLEVAKGGDTAIFHGGGGYAAPIPFAALRQLRPVLADKVDGAPVEGWRREAAPLQLAWPNVEQPGIDTDPRMRWWWVAGVKKVEVQNWIATYGRALRVPTGSNDDARLGAEAISVSCMGCHRVRGVGGTRGPELTGAAVSRDLPTFAARMREHLAKASGMASAPETGPAAARQIASFLRAVDLAGARPEEEIQPPELPPLPPPLPGGYGPGI